MKEENKFFHFLVCPQTGGHLVWHKESQELWCKSSGLAYKVKDGVACMLIEEARVLTSSEYESM